MSTPFHIVDVFSRRPFAGNPVAIVLAPNESAATMRAIAGWTGMPETVFVTTPTRAEADYALRIFSPLRELAFAGHPSIGACHLLLERGLVQPRGNVLTQECPAGLFEMRIDAGRGSRTIGFTVRAETVTPLPPATLAEIGDALGAVPDAVYAVEAGARWITARFGDAATLATLRPAFAQVRALSEAAQASGVSAFSPSPDADADVEVRSFAPAIGIDEDAVCGSGNACVAATMAHAHDDPSVVVVQTVSQGRHRGRRGRVKVRASKRDATVLVAGEAVTTASGTIELGVAP